MLTFRGVGYVCMYGSLSKLKENDQDRASTHTGTIYVSGYLNHPAGLQYWKGWATAVPHTQIFPVIFDD